jgi:hypothetical protein
MNELNTLNITTYIQEDLREHLEVIHSGITHAKRQNSVKIKIANLIFVFSFKEDEGKSRYESVEIDGVLHIYLFNHNNILGDGIFDPIVIAGIVN